MPRLEAPQTIEDLADRLHPTPLYDRRAKDLASVKQRMRGRALTVLAARGIELHGSGGVRRSLPAVLARYQRGGLSPATVIDVGVGPAPPSCARPSRFVPAVHDVVAWMHEHGFVVADFYDGHDRLIDRALAQFDVAFLQERGRFRRESRSATPDQADAPHRSWGY